MSADDFIQFLTQALFVLVFIAVFVEAVRAPLRANLDIAFFFGFVSVAVAETWILALLHQEPDPLVAALSGSLIMALPYLLLRLVDDFGYVRGRYMRAAELGLAISVVGLSLVPEPRPIWLTLWLVAYFFVVMVIASVAFYRQGRRSSGVTRRRMDSVAIASAALGLAVVMAGLQAGLPAGQPVWQLLARLFGLIAGLGYVLGFAPPGLVRRAWQEPELRVFLGRAAQLPRLPNTAAIARALETGAAASLGAPHAVISLWEEDAGGLVAPSWDRADLPAPVVRPGTMIAGRVFEQQEALFWANAPHSDPGNADLYHLFGARAVLAAPITAGQKRLGVLSAYAPRAPIFAREDLDLLKLLADQAAVILESRALIDEATRLRAREEANRLKDDFLSAAAHDLKTPLTTLLAQAQLMERRAEQNPSAPADRRGIRRMISETQRLNTLVLALLDASRVEQGRLIGQREPIDLADLVREATERVRSSHHDVAVMTAGPAIGEYDRVRILQLIDNLLENAIKYSPNGGTIRVRVVAEGETALLTVSDPGIGVPAADLELIFDRFQRGTNVDDRRFAGMGLGLFICRGIVEQHGGRIWATSTPGEGSTFQVALPLTANVAVA